MVTRDDHAWLRFSLIAIVVAGCGGSSFQTVSSERWQTVPPAERAAIDHGRDEDIASAAKDEAQARDQLAVARKRAVPMARRVPAAPPAELDASARASWQADQAARSKALTAIDAQRTAWQRDEVAWYQARLDAAHTRVDLMRCQREYMRAEAVDEHMQGTEIYDTADYRRQLGAANEAYYRAVERVRAARRALDASVAALAATKESYAALVRAGAPTATASAPRGPRMTW